MLIRMNLLTTLVTTPIYFFYILPNHEDDHFHIIHGIVTLMTLGYVIQEIYEFCRTERKYKHIKDIWNWIDFGLFFFFFISHCVKWMSYFSNKKSDTFDGVYDQWIFYTVHTSIEGILLSILWLRIEYYFRASQFIGSLLVITFQMIRDIVYFIS